MAKSAIEEIKAGNIPATPAAANAAPTPTVVPAANRSTRPAIDRNAVIEVLNYNNPKRGVSRGRYAHYKTGMTVDEYVKLAGTKGMPDIRWDQEVHGPTALIKLHPAGTKLKDAGKRVSS